MLWNPEAITVFEDSQKGVIGYYLNYGVVVSGELEMTTYSTTNMCPRTRVLRTTLLTRFYGLNVEEISNPDRDK
ncbi:hypothetical protein Hanom_Chr17g01563311 [Helianthus anomalus]